MRTQPSQVLDAAGEFGIAALQQKGAYSTTTRDDLSGYCGGTAAVMTLFWIALFAAGALVLAYLHVSLRTATLSLGLALAAYTWFGHGSLAWQIALWVGFTLLALLNLAAVRMQYLTKPFLRVYRRLLPSMSDTEREALEAGTVWWDGELFTGKPDWSKLLVCEGAAR